MKPIFQLLAFSLATEIVEIVSNQEQPFELCERQDSTLTKIQLTDFGATKSIVYKNNKIAPDFINLFRFNEQTGKIISKNVITRSNYNGTYECIEDRTWTQEVTVVAVVVLDQPSQPDCGFPLGNVLVEGNTVKFTCQSSEGYPEPDYFWFHNDSEIDHTRKDVVITVNENLSTLTIPKVTSIHMGPWYCAAANRVAPEKKIQCPARYFRRGTMSQGTILIIIISLVGFLSTICLLAFVMYLTCCNRNQSDTCFCFQHQDDEEASNDIEIDLHPNQLPRVEKGKLLHKNVSETSSKKFEDPPDDTTKKIDFEPTVNNPYKNVKF